MKNILGLEAIVAACMITMAVSFVLFSVTGSMYIGIFAGAAMGMIAFFVFGKTVRLVRRFGALLAVICISCVFGAFTVYFLTPPLGLYHSIVAGLLVWAGIFSFFVFPFEDQ